jgi:hypothetical protein
VNIADFFRGREDALAIHEAVQKAVAQAGPSEVRVSKSQVGFYRKHPFAATWMPGLYLARQDTPLVLSVYLKRRDPSLRWKEIVEPAHGRFTHHAELKTVDDVDDFIRQRLAEAWAEAA